MKLVGILLILKLIIATTAQRGDMGFIEDDEVNVKNLETDNWSAEGWRGDAPTWEASDGHWRKDTPVWQTDHGPIIESSSFNLPPLQYPTGNQLSLEHSPGYVGHLKKYCKVIKGHGDHSLHHGIYPVFGQYHSKVYDNSQFYGNAPSAFQSSHSGTGILVGGHSKIYPANSEVNTGLSSIVYDNSQFYRNGPSVYSSTHGSTSDFQSISKTYLTNSQYSGLSSSGATSVYSPSYAEVGMPYQGNTYVQNPVYHTSLTGTSINNPGGSNTNNMVSDVHTMTPLFSTINSGASPNYPNNFNQNNLNANLNNAQYAFPGQQTVSGTNYQNGLGFGSTFIPSPTEPVVNQQTNLGFGTSTNLSPVQGSLNAAVQGNLNFGSKPIFSTAQDAGSLSDGSAIPTGGISAQGNLDFGSKPIFGAGSLTDGSAVRTEGISALSPAAMAGLPSPGGQFSSNYPNHDNSYH